MKSLELAFATYYYGSLGKRQPDTTRYRGVEARSHKDVKMGACRGLSYSPSQFLGASRCLVLSARLTRLRV
jgi:hypothetical protein